MRDLSTFFQICIYITIVTIIFTLSISFVGGLGVFPTNTQSGINVGDDPAGAFEDMTTLTDSQGNYGSDALWALTLGSTAGLIAGGLLGWMFHSTALLGISIFAGIFWSSYISAFSIITSMGFLGGLESFILVGSVGMLFIFAGAVAGMLSGSG